MVNSSVSARPELTTIALKGLLPSVLDEKISAENT
jgi:hypothetical protein